SRSTTCPTWCAMPIKGSRARSRSASEPRSTRSSGGCFVKRFDTRKATSPSRRSSSVSRLGRFTGSSVRWMGPAEGGVAFSAGVGANDTLATARRGPAGSSPPWRFDVVHSLVFSGRFRVLCLLGGWHDAGFLTDWGHGFRRSLQALPAVDHLRADRGGSVF